MKTDPKVVKRGDIFWANLGSVDKNTPTSIQLNRRPVVVVSNNQINKYSPVVTVVPLTTKQRNEYLPTHISIRCVQDSICLAEQIRVVDKTVLGWYIGRAFKKDMKRLNHAIRVHLSI